MRKALYLIIPWAILLLPFLILTAFYNSLPTEIAIYRDLYSGSETLASKSLFTVFRVPLIEIVCALAIEIMRRRSAGVEESERQKSYYLMWTILLYTAAFKSLFQTLEIISLYKTGAIFFYLTIVTIIAGIISASLPGRKAFSGPAGTRRKIASWEKLALIALFVTYLALAISRAYIFG